jgi:hypothetical protein
MQQQRHTQHADHQHQDAGIDCGELGNGAQRQLQRQAVNIGAAEDPAQPHQDSARQVKPATAATGIRCRKKLRGGRRGKMQRAEQRQAGL